MTATALLAAQTLLQQHMLGEADAAPLVDGDPTRAAQRLGIYAQAYRLRLADTLADGYAKTRLWLGSERFDRACQRYIATHPPTTRSLRWYGDHFADALAGWLPAEPVVAELARLDWALRSAFDGPDAAVLEAAAVGALPPEAWATLGFRLQPTAQWLTFHHNTVAIWQALDDDAEPPALQAGEPVTWLVWRKGLQPHFRSLHPVEATLLRELHRGHSFATACALASEQAGDSAAQHIGGCLRQWLEDELLSAVVRPD